jgi:hypothetical protein
MSQAFRIILIALLVLALPLRGYAATAMQTCQLSHHGQTASVAPHHSHDHGGQAGHSAHGAQHDHKHDGADGSGAPSHETCSACGACCLGASAAPPFVPALMFTSRSSPIPFLAWTFSSVVLDNAERPPLHLLA